MDCESGCCGSGCCETSRQVVIDFLYLDLDICGRCKGTGDALTEAVADVGQVLKNAGFDVTVRKTLVDTRQKAIECRLISSPTIRVNGQDIDTDVKETQCECCGDLCGEDVDCRVWTYQGREYTVPPKALIVDAILKAVYGQTPASDKEKPYTLPENLEKFFEAVEKRK
ncbi:MAG: DUF2703 domain-containing protein [Eubacteriales bacterium]|nr:DUF2703 domain-containing protein [Eubacteriales bacterium]